VVGVADALKGQVAMAFAVVRDARSIESLQQRQALEGEVLRQVDSSWARWPGRRAFTSWPPCPRPGPEIAAPLGAGDLRRARSGDMTTIEDPSTLEQIRAAVAG